jgi:recombinational DNA repair protein RecR
MTKQAWFCPACQKHHATHCDTCPEDERQATHTIVIRQRIDAIGKDRMPNFPAAGAILKGYRLG